MVSLSDPVLNRAVTGVSGDAFRAACSAFLPGATATAAVQRNRLCVQASQHPASQSSLI